MSKEIGVGYKTLIPEFNDDASIEEALSVYHYGVDNYSTGSTIPSNSIEGHFSSLNNRVSEVESDLDNISTVIDQNAIKRTSVASLPNVIVPDSISTVPLAIRSFSASQSSNLQEWRDSSNNVLSFISATGTLSITGSITNPTNNNSSSSSFNFRRSRGSASAQTIISNGDTLGSINFAGFDGTNYINAARIVGESDNSPGSNDMPGRIIFSTTADSTASLVERLRIDSNGRIKIPSGGVLEAPVVSDIKTSNYTLTINDSGKLIEMNSTSPTTLILTIPTNSSVPFPIGTKIDVLRIGSGEVTISGASGVTVNSESSKNKINAQWQAVTIIKRSENTWALIGALKT